MTSLKKHRSVLSDHPSRWPLGTSLSLNDWADGHVDIEAVHQAGIKVIELAWRNDAFDLFNPVNERTCRFWIENSRELGISIWTLHLPYGPAFDISAVSEAASVEASRLLCRLMQLAHEWGIPMVVLHPSWEPITDEERPQRLEACRRALSVLADEAEALGIRIAVECLPRTCLGNSGREIASLLAADPGLGICCDVNHLLLEAPECFIREQGERIFTVHMSDCDGRDERHWMPGMGSIRWDEVLRALVLHDYQGPFMFEVRRPVPSELAACWERLIKSYDLAYPKAIELP